MKVVRAVRSAGAEVLAYGTSPAWTSSCVTTAAASLPSRRISGYLARQETSPPSNAAAFVVCDSARHHNGVSRSRRLRLSNGLTAVHHLYPASDDFNIGDRPDFADGHYGSVG